MKLSPRRTSPGTLSFAKGRLGVFTPEGFVARDVKHLDGGALSFPLAGPRALTTLVDGSFLAAGSTKTLRLLPHEEKPLTLSRILLLPESTLFGDRVRPDRVWVLPGRGTTLYGYDAVRGESLVAPREWIELTGFDHRALGSVLDGSFLQTTAGGLAQFYGKGPQKPVTADVAGLTRILPASRPDTVWLLFPKSAKLVRLLAGKTNVLTTVSFETTLFDADTAGGLLAVLELAQPDDAPWSFSLEVFDVTGKRRGRSVLPAEEALGPDWEATLVRDRAVAVSADPALVAVGGQTHLDVFRDTGGEPLFSGPADPGR